MGREAEEQEATGKAAGFRKRYWLFLMLPIVVVSVQYVLFRGVAGFNFFADEEAMAQFGDSFGWVNALFSGLTITILLQRSELQLQRQELALQRKEMSNSRAELAKSAGAQERSARMAAIVALIDHCDWQLEVLEKTSTAVYMPKHLKAEALEQWNSHEIVDRKRSLVAQLSESLGAEL